MNNRLDLTSLEKALSSLNRALVRAMEAPIDEELRDAAIQRFEYTFELCWKMLKRQLEQELPNPAEADGYSYKQLFRVGGERGLIDNVEAWFEYRERRNITSHTYDADKAQKVFEVIPQFAADAKKLFDVLSERNAS
jgi:nucleotidyltransferase substrate binding protein (TIGR01987 family)